MTPFKKNKKNSAKRRKMSNGLEKPLLKRQRASCKRRYNFVDEGDEEKHTHLSPFFPFKLDENIEIEYFDYNDDFESKDTNDLYSEEKLVNSKEEWIKLINKKSSKIKLEREDNVDCEYHCLSDDAMTTPKCYGCAKGRNQIRIYLNDAEWLKDLWEKDISDYEMMEDIAGLLNVHKMTRKFYNECLDFFKKKHLE